MRVFLTTIFFFSALLVGNCKLFAQRDSLWSVFILEKGKNPEIKEDMIEYSPLGFFLYRNCFYDIELKKGKRQTIRLIDIKQDTLVFIGISSRTDVNPNLTSTDTLVIDYQDIRRIHLLRNWDVGNSRKIRADKHYFIFQKTTIDYRLDSKYGNVFGNDDGLTELTPRLSAHGTTYHFEHNSKLHYHSGIEVKTPKYSDEEIAQTLNGIMTVLDFIVNKRVNVTVSRR
jgi:hypothetical protein